MTITIDLPNDVQQRLEQQARLRGTTLSEAIAQLLDEFQASRTHEFWEKLEAEGRVAKRKPAPPDDKPFQPIQVQGKPLSEVIVEERR
ncbi:MAG: hypothetical protein JNK38_01275 [Acidobacteria bacterium]|nr:hypothetical protein [Acidobacteriota bacterium]